MSALEIKYSGDTCEISGYGSVWMGAPDSKRDVVAAGSFADSLARGLPQMRREHKSVVGQWTSAVEDDCGLKLTGTVTDTTTIRDLRAGKIDGLSIGFIDQKSSRRSDGVRVLQQVDLAEVSLVKSPAKSAARILQVKSADAGKGSAMETDVTALADEGAATETKSVGDQVNEALASAIKPLTDRLGKVEVALKRPGAAALETKSTDAETKALAVFCRTGSDLEVKAASVGSDPAGGYSVLPQLDTTIRKVARDITPLRQLATVVTLNSDAYEVLVDASDAGASWVSEAGARAETTEPELIKVRIPANEIYAAPRATQMLIDDSSVDIGAWLTGAVSDKFARTEATAFVSGDGSGKPTGFLNYATATTVDFTRAWGTLQHVVSGHATSLTADGLVNVSMSLRAPYRSGAKWLMNRATATVVRQLKDGDGRYLWGDGSVNNGSPNNLLGFEVVLSEDMPNIGAGTFPIALGDWKSGYTIVDRHGVRLIRDNLTAKPYTIFYCYKRVGGDVTDFNAIKLCKVSA